MIDRLFSGLLTFCLLAGGTAAIASAMFDFDSRAAAQRAAAEQRPVAHLPAVTVIGKREAGPVANNEMGENGQAAGARVQ